MKVSRYVLLAGVSLLAGCAGHGTPTRAQLQSKVQNLGWDVVQVKSDLFVARLDVGEQRRRVRQAQANLLLTRVSAPQTRCSAAQIASHDRGHAADGVTAVKNDRARVEVDLAYVARDLAALDRDLQRASIDRAGREEFSRVVAGGRRVAKTLEDQAAASIREATHLRGIIDRYAQEAMAICTS